MSSIGILVKASDEIEDLHRDWVPEPLGPRKLVEEAVAEALSGPRGLRLTADIESLEESVDPRSVSFSGVWGKDELAAIKQLCLRLDARFYDAEECSFIPL